METALLVDKQTNMTENITFATPLAGCDNFHTEGFSVTIKLKDERPTRLSFSSVFLQNGNVMVQIPGDLK